MVPSSLGPARDPLDALGAAGPYHQWTRKIDGKTTTINLTDEQFERYGSWFVEVERLRRLLNDLDELTLLGSRRKLERSKIALKGSANLRNVSQRDSVRRN